MPLPEILIIAAACVICAGIGSVATWWRIGRRGRADYRRGVRDTERLIHQRQIDDRRDQTSARVPFT